VSTRLTLAAPARHAFDRLAEDLARVFGPRFVALVASGHRSGVAFATDITGGDLEAFAVLADTWHRDGLDTPLILTPTEFRRSLDAFPLEYQAIVDHHLVIAGHPPFEDLVIETQHLRRACEAQAKSHLIHLRQGWIDAAGHEHQLSALIARSAAPLRALLGNVARLGNQLAQGEEHLALTGARLAGLDVDLVREVLASETGPDHARHLVRRLQEYLVAAETLWAFVDAWTSA
jgi:hypothetical protein